MNWASDINWQTKVLNTRKVTQLNLPRQESVKRSGQDGPCAVMVRSMDTVLYYNGTGAKRDPFIVSDFIRGVGIMDSALCDCKEAEQTVHTSSRTVPSGGNRHQLWLQDESTTNKLWGMAEDLRRTTQYLATCVLRVWARLIDHRRRRRRRRRPGPHHPIPGNM